MNNSINFPMVKLLVLKDWYLMRWTIYAALGGGAAALAITAVSGKLATLIGIILLVTVVVAFGVQVAVATVINERKEQTLAFVMSLPINAIDYTAAKMLANVVTFAVPWLAISAGAVALVLAGPASSHGLVPYVSIMAVELLLSTFAVFAVAITTESQPVTVAVMIAGNIAFDVWGYVVAHIASIAATMYGPRIVWTTAGLGLLATELAAIGLVLGVTFLIQSRKTDFL